VKFWLRADEKAAPADLIEAIRASGMLLEAVVKVSRPVARA